MHNAFSIIVVTIAHTQALSSVHVMINPRLHSFDLSPLSFKRDIPRILCPTLKISRFLPLSRRHRIPLVPPHVLPGATQHPNSSPGRRG